MADAPTMQLSELVNQLKQGNQNLSKALVNLNTTLTNLFPRGFGSFTMAGSATTTVTNTNVQANSIIALMPTNAAAGTLMGGTKSLYVSARAAGASFTVATASGVAAAGTETFSYSITTPV